MNIHTPKILRQNRRKSKAKKKKKKTNKPIKGKKEISTN